MCFAALDGRGLVSCAFSEGLGDSGLYNLQRGVKGTIAHDWT